MSLTQTSSNATGILFSELAEPEKNNGRESGKETTHGSTQSKTRPANGQRFEAHRIGMEDAELLLQLKAIDAESSQQLIEQVLRRFDDYETDVQAYRKTKQALLERLDRIESK